jgi:hypothetical protein
MALIPNIKIALKKLTCDFFTGEEKWQRKKYN